MSTKKKATRVQINLRVKPLYVRTSESYPKRKNPVKNRKSESPPSSIDTLEGVSIEKTASVSESEKKQKKEKKGKKKPEKKKSPKKEFKSSPDSKKSVKSNGTSFDSRATPPNFLCNTGNSESRHEVSAEISQETQVTFADLNFPSRIETPSLISTATQKLCHQFETNHDTIKDFERYRALYQVQDVARLKREFTSWVLLLLVFVILLFYRAQKVHESCVAPATENPIP